MAVVNSTIFQIVGFQNSGKTTFLKKLIEELNNEKITAVTIKHHGHGGKPELIEEKDSSHHLKAGAIASIVEGDGRLLLHSEKSEWTIDEKIQLASFFRPGVILIEGHKYVDFPKGVIIRSEEDLVLLQDLKNIKIVFYWNESILEKTASLSRELPFYQIDNPSGYEWIVNFIKSSSRLL